MEPRRLLLMLMPAYPADSFFPGREWVEYWGLWAYARNLWRLFLGGEFVVGFRMSWGRYVCPFFKGCVTLRSKVMRLCWI